MGVFRAQEIPTRGTIVKNLPEKADVHRQNKNSNHTGTVFLPHLSNTHAIRYLCEKDAGLLMDNCSFHLSSLRSLSNVSRLPVCKSLLSHRILGKSFRFSIWLCLECWWNAANINYPAETMLRTPDSSRKWITISGSKWLMWIYGAFRSIAIAYSLVDGVQWFPAGDLSIRRRNAKFGWIKSPE
jgi:hypothetical protein